MPEDLPLRWLDQLEEGCSWGIRSNFKNEISLLERQINVISVYVNDLGKARKGTGLTIKELKNSQNEELIRFMVPAFLMFQALDNLQAMRLNLLHGYLSVVNSCLRNVAEALRWANTAAYSAEVAREWLRNGNYRKPHNFTLAPPVQELIRLLDRLSKGGAHPLATARSYSALAKPGSSTLLGDELREEGIHSSLNLANQVCANVLFFLVGQFNQFFKKNLLLQEKVSNLTRDLDDIFGIKFLT
ncbi:MAG: hypothetical protein PHI12_06210 [Dehalococcoidales bacterium]|nr:hypothetical protein [Dehalococcoidales bacterium]